MLRQSEVRASKPGANKAAIAKTKTRKSPKATFVKIDRLKAKKRFLEGDEIVLVPCLISPDDNERTKTISLASDNPMRFIGRIFFTWLVDQSSLGLLNSRNGSTMNYYLKT